MMPQEQVGFTDLQGGYCVSHRQLQQYEKYWLRKGHDTYIDLFLFVSLFVC